MDIQALLDAVSKAGETARSDYHLTLSKAADQVAGLPPETVVNFDGKASYPAALYSYRGYYSDLSVSPCEVPMTAGDLADMLSSALGETFTGYKGGDYTMHAHTPLWCAGYGDTGPAIMSLRDNGDGTASFLTKEID